jgi:hypothetical protein
MLEYVIDIPIKDSSSDSPSPPPPSPSPTPPSHSPRPAVTNAADAAAAEPETSSAVVLAGTTIALAAAAEQVSDGDSTQTQRRPSWKVQLERVFRTEKETDPKEKARVDNFLRGVKVEQTVLYKDVGVKDGCIYSVKPRSIEAWVPEDRVKEIKNGDPVPLLKIKAPVELSRVSEIKAPVELSRDSMEAEWKAGNDEALASEIIALNGEESGKINATWLNHVTEQHLPLDWKPGWNTLDVPMWDSPSTRKGKKHYIPTTAEEGGQSCVYIRNLPWDVSDGDMWHVLEKVAKEEEKPGNTAVPQDQRLFGDAQGRKIFTRPVYLFTNGTIQARWSVSLKPSVSKEKNKTLVDAFSAVVEKEVEEEGKRNEDECTTVYRTNEREAKAVVRRLTAKVFLQQQLRERSQENHTDENVVLEKFAASGQKYDAVQKLITKHFADAKRDEVELQKVLDNVGTNYFKIEEDKPNKFKRDSQLEQVKEVRE